MEFPHNLGRRIGVLGGTFDPVHNGHLAVAEAVRQELSLSAILFVPAFSPPHKPTYAISAFQHRVAMLDLAVAERTGYSVSRMEAKREGPSYSIDTLRSLAHSLGQDVHLFFIIGMDAFTEVFTWKEHGKLLDHASFVVVGRPDHCKQSCGQTVAANFPGYVFVEATGNWQGQPGQGFIDSVTMPPVTISSTEIREAVMQGRSISNLVPVAVADYIKIHALYHGDPS